MLVAKEASPKQESVSLVTTKTTVLSVTPESGLVLEEIPMTLIRAETRLHGMPTTETRTSRLWGTSWYSSTKSLMNQLNTVSRQRYLLGSLSHDDGIAKESVT